MTSTTTVLIVVSGKGFGPFFAPGWRASGIVQLVEGSSRGPFLLTSSLGITDQQPVGALFINGLEASAVADAVLLVLSAQVGDENLQLGLLSSQILSSENGNRVFSEKWSLSESLRVDCLSQVTEQARVGIVIMESDSVFSSDVVKLIQEWGLDLVVYEKSQDSNS